MRIQNCLAVCLLRLAALTAAAVLFRFDPEQYPFYPVCMFHRTTGLLCPGCGSLRALHHLLHGELGTAFRFNAPVVCGVILALCWFTPLALAHLLARLPRSHAPTLLNRVGIRPGWLWVGLAVLIVFAIARNLPLAQAAMLSPPVLVR